jgi:hypothetical protein
MSTVTAAFPTASVRRSQAVRFTDGVVAGYIHAVAGGSRTSARVHPQAVGNSAAVEAADIASYATESAEMVDTAIEANRAQTPHDAGRPRKSACWNRGGRVAHAMQAQRVLGAR